MSTSATIVCRAERANLLPTTVRIRDVSRTGISLLIDRPIEVGTMVTLDVPGEAGPTSILACVRHRTANSDGGWMVGCSFAAELGDGDLAGFGVTRSETPSADQRRWARIVPTASRVVLRTLGDKPGPPSSAHMLNLSPGGVGLAAVAHVEPGTLLDLELIGGPNHPGLTVLASVVFAAPRGDGRWVLGCTFIRELSDVDLRALS